MNNVMNKEMCEWAVAQYENGQSIRRIADALFIHETTARRHIFLTKEDAYPKPLVYSGSFVPDKQVKKKIY